ncbi:hypothetical protein QBC44DRAFT_373520 [Cladorrhinum sp. PSN332]|nr:hypothetical protein QBC44DRAFT_373520 [Cladorrhinum sp. PSN332]
MVRIASVLAIAASALLVSAHPANTNSARHESPKVADCRALADSFRSNDNVYNFMSTLQTTLGTHGTCLFAAGADGLPGGIKMAIGGEDIYQDIMSLIVDGDGNEKYGVVGGLGRQLCPQSGDTSNGPKDQTTWYIYNTSHPGQA